MLRATKDILSTKFSGQFRKESRLRHAESEVLMMARPGVMLYFDIRKPLQFLENADKGRLLDAILEYGEYGTVPEFEGMLAVAWGFIQPKIDKDAKDYERVVLKRRYATDCRERKQRGDPDISFNEWLRITGSGEDHMISHDVKWYPTTTASPSPSPTATGTTTSSTTKTTSISTAAAVTATETDDIAAATAERKVKMLGGELGKNVVFLSDAQIEDLLDKMDLETFDYYVEKLASFIIKNDARVKNHYETILKWWREDGSIPRQ
jgi:hypothetical protein